MLSIADSAAPLARRPPHTAEIYWLELVGDHEKEGLWARISPIDAERCEAHAWRADPRSHTTYAKANVKAMGRAGKIIWTTISLHRFIAQPPEHFETHHRDLDGLNCVRSNLENVTHGVNMFHRGPGVSGFYGVSAFRKKWRAQLTIFHDGLPSRNKHIGIFDTALDAAFAYDVAARAAYGPFVRCNFPLENDP